jgi:hypothetical protein
VGGGVGFAASAGLDTGTTIAATSASTRMILGMFPPEVLGADLRGPDRLFQSGISSTVLSVTLASRARPIRRIDNRQPAIDNPSHG